MKKFNLKITHFVGLFALLLLFMNCDTESDPIIPEQQLSFTTIDDQFSLKYGNNFEDYTVEISEELLNAEGCADEYVSGVVEFYYEGVLIFWIDFGDGACDGIASITYLDVSGDYVTEFFELDYLYDDDDDYQECFEFVYPITFIMPDDSELIIEGEDDWYLLWDWYDENEDDEWEEDPEVVFPIQLVDVDGNLITVNSEEELENIFEECDDFDDDEEDDEDEDDDGDDDDSEDDESDEEDDSEDETE